MIKQFLFAISFTIFTKLIFAQSLILPIKTEDRSNVSTVQMTTIGNYGEYRKERPGVPAHLHTGIDIKRPSKNYKNEPILAICKGTVISIRNDGPYAQIIIEHNSMGKKFWSVYEHIAGIITEVGNTVDENTTIARFMNKSELEKYGWQFDHFHLEILKIPPLKVKPSNHQPNHFFKTYNLICYTVDELNYYYYNPINLFNGLYE